MNYGIQLKSDKGYYNIDNKSSSFVKVYNNITGNFSGAWNLYYAYDSYTDSNITYKGISINLLDCLVAFQPITEDFISVTLGGEDIKFNTTAQITNPAYRVKYKVFKPINTTINDLWLPSGDKIKDSFLLKNDRGEFIFSDIGEHLKIKEIRNITLTDDTSNYVDISHPNIKNPYYILISNGLIIEPGVGNYFYTVGVKKLSDTSFRVGWFWTYKVFVASNTIDNEDPYQLLILE